MTFILPDDFERGEPDGRIKRTGRTRESVLMRALREGTVNIELQFVKVGAMLSALERESALGGNYADEDLSLSGLRDRGEARRRSRRR